MLEKTRIIDLFPGDGWLARLPGGGGYFAQVSHELVATSILAVSLFLLVHFCTWAVARQRTLPEQRFWRLTFRNLAALGFLIGMGIIWRGQLQSVVFALSAATAGILLCFKEAFLSLMAFWIRVVKRHYGLGDFIEIDGIRGEVLDITWQHTVLAETGPGKDALTYSGRVVQIPNNRMLLAPFFVDNFTGTFGAHIIQVPLPEGANILRAEAILQEAAERVCSPFYEDARQHMESLRRSRAIDTPSVEPKPRIRFSDRGEAVLVMRCVMPFREKNRLEHQILHDFLSQVDEAAWPGMAGTSNKMMELRAKRKKH